VRRLAPVLGLLALAACAVNLPVPDLAMAGGDAARLEELQAGRRLYVNKCSGCHALEAPEARADAVWASEIEEMLAKKKVRLSHHERERLVLYLTTANGRD
jgi:mono/diheme cytochrome c family protein